jgi:hypothetical protein
LGSEVFVEKIGVLIGRDLRQKKPGRKVREGWYKYGVPGLRIGEGRYKYGVPGLVPGLRIAGLASPDWGVAWGGRTQTSTDEHGQSGKGV